MEEGVVILVGITTANPFFAVNDALVSRSRVFEFQPLSVDDIKTWSAARWPTKTAASANIEATIDDDALEFLAEVTDGDARRASARWKSPCCLQGGPSVSDAASPSAGRRLTRTTHPRTHRRRRPAQGDPVRPHRRRPLRRRQRLIKSIRGSDPDAGIYWLARMLEGGEDVRFLARRLVILASEDIGNADPHALPLAVAAMQACEFVGLPECQLTLAQA